MTHILRITKFALQNLGRNMWLTAMTIVVLTVTLLSVNVLLSLNALARAVSTSLENRIDVSVYLKPAISEDDALSVRSYLAGLPQTQEVRTISPDEALAMFRERHQNDVEVLKALDEVGENPLGTTFVVRARALDQYPEIIASLDHPAYRDLITEKNFEDYSALISRVENIQNKIQQFGIILLAVFVLIAMIIMINAVRVAIFTHKEEIAIMKLVGASGAFIRGPFLLESLILSIFALAISTGLLIGAVYAVSPLLTRFLGTDPGLFSFFKANAVLILVGEFGALALLTSAASAYAVGRYMKK